MPKKSIRLRIGARDHGICAKCKEFHEEWTVDHIIAKADGGTNHMQNLQTLCPDCHLKKTKRDDTRRNFPVEVDNRKYWSLP